VEARIARRHLAARLGAGDDPRDRGATVRITGATTSSCQMPARSGNLRDSPITILAIAGSRPPLIIAAARDRSMGASSAKGPSKASAVLSIVSRCDTTAARATPAPPANAD
jgi:hypothetical protein